MKTVRLEGMTDAEYKLITQSECPYCGSRDTARTNYSNVHSTFRNVDVTCDACGRSWSMSEHTGPIRQLQLPTRDGAVKAIANAVVKAIKDDSKPSKPDLSKLSDNKLKHMRKSELVLLADRYGLIDEDANAGVSKANLVSLLIRERDGES